MMENYSLVRQMSVCSTFKEDPYEQLPQQYIPFQSSLCIFIVKLQVKNTNDAAKT